jgi:2-iminobutanoate/2-iminopropanoate deaminase
MSAASGAGPGWEPVELGGDLPRAAGAYSRAARAAGLLFVSGQIPRDFRTGELAGPDVESQTRAVLDNLRAVLTGAGAGLEDVVAVTVYLQDVDDWDRFNAVYRQVMPEPYPSRTVVGAELRGIRVELSAIAVAPG